jgi:hypothetical protein
LLRTTTNFKTKKMSLPKVKYQQVTLNITGAGLNVPIDFETDMLYKKVTGINVIMTDETNKFSTLNLDINSTEIFPEDFEVLRVLFRSQIPFGYEYHELNERAEGSRVKGKYIDNNGGAPFPYKVVISLRLENE